MSIAEWRDFSVSLSVRAIFQLSQFICFEIMSFIVYAKHNKRCIINDDDDDDGDRCAHANTLANWGELFHIHGPIQCVLAAGRTKQQLGTGALLLVVEAAPQFAELQLSLRVQFIIYSDRHHLSRNYKPRWWIISEASIDRSVHAGCNNIITVCRVVVFSFVLVIARPHRIINLRQ